MYAGIGNFHPNKDLGVYLFFGFWFIIAYQPRMTKEIKFKGPTKPMKLNFRINSSTVTF